jgi:hypothetical protein
MARPGNRTRSETELADAIRRQIGTEVNRRHLARMPAFVLQRETPTELTSLLAEMDTAERKTRPARMSTGAAK